MKCTAHIVGLRWVFQPRTSLVKRVTDVSKRVNMSNESHYVYSTFVEKMLVGIGYFVENICILITKQYYQYLRT
jgi:hypothetical protein